MSASRLRTAASAAAGVAILGLLVAFSTVLSDGPDADSVDIANDLEPVVLPDQLGDLVALDSGSLPPEIIQQLADPASLKDAQSDASDRISTIFEARATFRIYADRRAQRLAIVTVLDKESGLFVPDGPPVAPDVTRPSYDVFRVGDTVCAVYYAVTQGQQSEPETESAVTRSHCQLSTAGRTYDMDAQGLEPNAVAAALDDLATADPP